MPSNGEQEQHPHVVRVWHTSVWGSDLNNVGKIVLLMDLHTGTLQMKLNVMGAENRYYSKFGIFDVAIQILEGLKYCHSRDYAHRDLSPRNGASFCPFAC